jgi:mRNA interferase MazF
MIIQRGDIYFVNLNPTKGREQSGRRPVLVVSNDTINALPLVITVIPGTKGIRVPTDYPGNVRVPAGEANLPDETVFMAFQIRALDRSRFQDPPVGRLSPPYQRKVSEALAWFLTLPQPTASSP